MTSTLFNLSFFLAAPFWALMILAPTWRVTRRVAASPLIVLPAVAVELVLLVPMLAEFWPVVTRPTLAGLQQLVTSPEALTALWAQIIAWDLFVGRWIYLDSRERGIHPLVMAPVLVFTIVLSPLALPLYLLIRLPYQTESRRSDTPEPALGRSMA
ncbi:ABA4-like family protein [Thermoactinospora rubra]|uniref:ABA4-like family protein n=1 Tax=Thermoactinospora rubra TaxID=1088767 RepID=UPI000A0F43B2|nr:ABA4-like family protein [Thermoactinospora rubra]